VGVAFWFIIRVTLGAGGIRQAPVIAFVSQRTAVTGRVALPVSADTVSLPPAPTFVVATAKVPVPDEPGMFTIPSLPGGAASAMTCGEGSGEAATSSVFSPTTVGARSVLVQLNPNWMSVASNPAVGVRVSTNVWFAPGAISTGVFGVPIGWFVEGSVAWN